MDKTPLHFEPDEIRRRTRRSFLVTGAVAAIGGGLWKWLNSRSRIDGLNAPFRKVLDFNAAIARGLFREGARAPEYAQSKAVRSFRRNGDIGLADLKIEDWRLQLVGVGDLTSYSQYSKDVTSWMYGTNPPTDESDDADIRVPAKKTAMHEDDAKGAAVSMKPMEMPENAHQRIPGLLLTMADVRKLPRIEMVTEFMCIEGWSEIVYWGGVRLRDFIEKVPPRIETASQFHPSEFVNRLPEYIAFETPDGQYYVDIERQVALHPQTLLAYEMNRQPLTPDHGAPLRLVTPLKYGIKQIKQIGRITYTNTRPRDYLARSGVWTTTRAYNCGFARHAARGRTVGGGMEHFVCHPTLSHHPRPAVSCLSVPAEAPLARLAHLNNLRKRLRTCIGGKSTCVNVVSVTCH